MPFATDIAEAIQRAISEGIKPKSLEEITKEYPPEELAMQFGPGGLAGVFRSNVVNKLLKDAAAHPEAGPYSKAVPQALINWMKALPTSVMEHVGGFHVRPEVTDPIRGTRVGGYFAREGVIPAAVAEPYVPGTPLPQGKNIQPVINIKGAGEAYGQYPMQYEGLPEMVTRTEHEWLHGLLDKIRQVFGEDAYQEIQRQFARGKMKHGPEEPFASSEFSSKEIGKIVDLYRPGLESTRSLDPHSEPIAKSVVRAMREGRISDKEVERFYDRLGSATYPVPSKTSRTGRTVKIVRTSEEASTHTRRNLEQAKEIREALQRQKAKREAEETLRKQLKRKTKSPVSDPSVEP